VVKGGGEWRRTSGVWWVDSVCARVSMCVCVCGWEKGGTALSQRCATGLTMCGQAAGAAARPPSHGQLRGGDAEVEGAVLEQHVLEEACRGEGRCGVVGRRAAGGAGA
jgi:hypothetical protein